MKAYINRKPVVGPWGGGNLWVKSCYELFPKFGLTIVDIDKNPDVIFIAGLGSEDGCISVMDAIRYKIIRKQLGHDVKLILRVNENDARKGTIGIDESIKEISKEMDCVVFVSKWLKDYFGAETWNVRTACINNGVDKCIFGPSSSKMNNQKINIVTHHWSDNFMKGFDIYDQIDRWTSLNEDYTFTYIGRDRGTFKNTRVIKPLFGKSLGEELSKYDVYVSASRFDPGPNHIIESLSCGLPTYVHKDGGGCVEFAGFSHVYENVDSLFKILKKKNYNLNTQWYPENWENCILRFASITKELTDDWNT